MSNRQATRMLMRIAPWVIASWVLAAAVLLTDCSKKVAGTTDETETRVGLHGKLVDPDGAAAMGATVNIYAVNSSVHAKTVAMLAGPQTAYAVGYTDSTGWFQIRLPLGTYNIEAQYADGPETLYAFQNGIVNDDTVKRLDPDTLRRPGMVKGVVIASEGADGIMCYIPGTSHVSITDSAGCYTLSDVPAGFHTLAYMGLPYNDTAVSGIKVLPGAISLIADIVMDVDPTQNVHGIWGNFAREFTGAIASVKTFMSGSSIPDSAPRIRDMSWDPVQGSFSGSVITPRTGDTWRIKICVWDTSAHLTGKTVVDLNRNAGPVPVLTFNPFNARPVAEAGNDTLVSINDTIRLHGTARDDTLGGSVIRTEWKRAGSDSFVPVSAGDTSVVVPDTAAILRYVLRVTDNDLNSVTDTMVAYVNAFAPALVPLSDTIYTTGRTAAVSAQASSRFGSIVRYYWDVGNRGFFDSTTAGTYTISPRPVGPVTLVWGARNDDGVLAKDTVHLFFNQSPSGLKMTSPLNLETVAFQDFNFTTMKGTARITLAAGDPDNGANPLTYAFSISEKSNRDSMIPCYQGSSPAFTVAGLGLLKTYYWYASVKDAHGDSTVTRGALDMPWTFSTPGLPVPSRPDSLHALAVTTSSIMLAWKNSPGAVKYEVFRSDAMYGAYALLDSCPGPVYDDTGLVINKTFYYKVCGVNQAGNSVFSNVCNARTHRSSDSAVVAYMLSPAQETQFIGSGPVSPFWNAWGGLDTTNLSYLDLTVSGNGWVDGSGRFDGDQDAELLIKVAYGAQGVYLLFEIHDDNFAALPYRPNTDILAAFFEKNNSDTIKRRNPYDYMPQADRHYTFTYYSTAYKVPVGATSLFPAYTNTFIGNDVADILADSATLAAKGFMMHMAVINQTTRVQEWLIPWNMVGAWGGLAGIPAVGTRFAFSCAYYDYDIGEDGLTKLGWKQRDPLSACPENTQSGGFCDSWGDIRLGPPLP